MSNPTGSGQINYSVTLSENGDGNAVISWLVSTSGTTPYAIGPKDWVGVFANANQATSNPNKNVIGGQTGGGWTYASGGGPFSSQIAIQPGQVAAYVIQDATNSGTYVTIAVTGPWAD